MDSTVIALILQNRQIAYALTDRELTVLEIGGATDTLHHGDQDPIPGSSLYELTPELQGSEAVLTDIIAGKSPHFQMDLINRESATGQTIYLTLAILPYHNHAGQITGLLHVTEDVTGRGVLEQRLVQQRNELRLLRDQLSKQNLDLAAANAELQRLDEMKSIFVSVTAHELRTPLASISGFSELLLDEQADPLTTEQREYVEIIERGAYRLLEITNNLLDVTRIEAGRMELVLRPADLSAIIQSLTAEFEPQLEAKRQTLTVRLQPDLPPVLCHHTRTAQIIGNLLSNASKYTPEGGQLTLSLTSGEEGFLQISVADNGIGIPAEDQPNLFSRFFRAENASSIGVKGTGLGLFITRSLVELHGGQIWFESQLDQGSTFHATFPTADGLNPA